MIKSAIFLNIEKGIIGNTNGIKTIRKKAKISSFYVGDDKRGER
jgi:hypothetical protein